jgi:site-specific recombinase XerD
MNERNDVSNMNAPEVESFILYCKGRRLSPKTIELYGIELRLLYRLMSEGLNAIAAHLAGVAPDTHARKLLIWKTFARTHRLDWYAILESMPKPKIVRGQPAFLTPDEVRRFRIALKEFDLDAQLFFELALSLGLRLSEIAGLNSNDIEGDWLKIRRKGGREQRLPLSNAIRAMLPPIQGRLFKRRPRFYQRLIKQIAERAGITKDISPHALRHTFATQKAASGHSLRVLQECLGHQKITTTERYMHVTPDHMREFILGKEDE